MSDKKLNLSHHGGLNDAELDALGIDPAQVLDFSTNINAYGPSPAALKAMVNTDISRYPDRDAAALRDALAKTLSLTPDHLMIGNGTSELIWLVSYQFLKKGDNVLICSPTFSEYERCARLMMANVFHCKANSENNFVHTVEEIQHAISDTCPKLCFVCNPNNPSGGLISSHSLDTLISKNPHTLFIIDEAYLAFVQGMETVYKPRQDNLIVLRSLTKEYALAGLRLGYALGHPQYIAQLYKIRPSWNVNAPAQAAGIASLRDKNHLSSSLQKLFGEKPIILKELGKIGYPVIPSSTHYFICMVGDAGTFRRSLLIKHTIQVRDCTSFGLPDFIRICTRTHDENQKLLTAMKELKQ